ncbi:MAG: sigma-70 family RNA polymerase sigma factor [Bacteroidetes bacterium]|nr:sigma-70 family RNA polymerase sigma factor [Bacteroidota bacterium]
MQTERVWNAFKDQLFRFILSRVKDSDAAADILQDVFVKIHLNLKNLQTENKLTSWLYQITRNAIVDHFRQTRPVAEISDLPDDVPDEKNYLKFEKCILGFVKELPDKYREALLKTELGKLSQKEYAEELGISYSGAKSRVQRAKEELRELFISCCAKKIPGTNGKLEFKDPDDCRCA